VDRDGGGGDAGEDGGGPERVIEATCTAGTTCPRGDLLLCADSNECPQGDECTRGLGPLKACRRAAGDAGSRDAATDG
jgi:hypothetical protein